MWRTTLILYLYFAISQISADEVIWLPNKSIKVAKNFKDGNLPCPKQTVVFPSNIQESVRIHDFSVSGLILPNDGELILENGVISLGAHDNNCTREGFAYYKDDSNESWEQPDAWSSKRFNKATPDAERIPCANDDVIFPENSQFTLKLPEYPQYITTLKVGGELINGRQLINLMMSQSNDQSQQFVMGLGGMTVHVQPDNRDCNSSPQGCPCQNFQLNIDCKLKYCPKAECEHPIKPLGHCCEICSAALVIKLKENFDMRNLKALVKNVVDGYGSENFDYHVGILPYYNKDNGYREKTVKAQVIVLDKGKYTGASLEVITDINHKLLDQHVEEKVLFLSGSPTSQSGQPVKIVFSVFFMVIFVMGSVYAYYYRMSELSLANLSFGFPRGVLSRLHNRTDSIVSLTRRDSTISSATTTGTAFRNPMYSSIRERVQVAESVLEE